MHGFGPVQPEPNEPVFHEEWEGIVLAMQQVTRRLGLFNVDEFRFGIERLDPATYLASSYYEKWLESIVTNLVEKGIVSADDIVARTALLGGDEAHVTSASTRGRASQDSATLLQ